MFLHISEILLLDELEFGLEMLGQNLKIRDYKLQFSTYTDLFSLTNTNTQTATSTHPLTHPPLNNHQPHQETNHKFIKINALKHFQLFSLTNMLIFLFSQMKYSVIKNLSHGYRRRYYNNNHKGQERAGKGQSDLSLHLRSFVTYQLSLSFCPPF